MPRTMQAAVPFRMVLDMLLIALRDLLRSFAADLADIAGASIVDPLVRRSRRARRLALVRIGRALRAVYIPTRQEVMTFLLMFSLGANLVTAIAIALHA